MLNLRKNSLRELPARFSNLTNLLIVDLSHNQFRDFPQPLCDTVSLQYIDISDCHISSIPTEIGKLRNVQVHSVQSYTRTDTEILVSLLSSEFSDLLFT